MSTVSIVSLIFSGCMLVLAVVTFIITQVSSSKSKVKEDDANMAEIREGIIKLNLKSDNLCTNLNEMRVDTRTQLKELSDKQREHDIMIAELQRDMKTAFNRYDELKGEISHER